MSFDKRLLEKNVLLSLIAVEKAVTSPGVERVDVSERLPFILSAPPHELQTPFGQGLSWLTAAFICSSLDSSCYAATFKADEAGSRVAVEGGVLYHSLCCWLRQVGCPSCRKPVRVNGLVQEETGDPVCTAYWTSERNAHAWLSQCCRISHSIHFGAIGLA